MKSILIIETPTNCKECPLSYWSIDGENCKPMKRMTEEEKPTWCPLSHPLKRASNDFYIYDRKYLFDHLEREINLLKGVKDFVKARETE